ncbi:MAG TPA: TonB-dependent receptor plug domain-containing protein [Candidatus Acidoferrales bacterium]|nr:TonB-dependent receptor plug domain-containing protein [Candidatus Acidoferrales bacterium]
MLRSKTRICTVLALALSLTSATASAQTVAVTTKNSALAGSPNDLSQLALEDLMNIKVTSVSKTDQKMSQVAAAIFVITDEDIQRSGATNIPDLLRMVPGMDVSQINANAWAVSARGFDGQFSDKLLVLIDGRAVYTVLLGGVNWDTQNVPLEDIGRIEVIRGPGATVWGANAVNGVINIVTKTAADTKGFLASGGGGTEGKAFGLVQYGGSLPKNTDYRVAINYLNSGSLPAEDGGSDHDNWNLLHGSFRADTKISPTDSLTVQGDMYTGQAGDTIIHIYSINPPVVGDQNVNDQLAGGNVLGRWNHVFSSRSDTTLQFYYDSFDRSGPESDESRRTLDFDFNHHFQWGSRQDVVWGIGYRRTWDTDFGTIDQSFNPHDTTLQLFTVFAQDTFTLHPNCLFLTAGTKLENSYFTGLDLDPSARLAWTPSSTMTLWAAVSRAARSPDRRDTELDAALTAFPDPNGSSTPVEVVLFGNPNFQNEHILAYEAGFRTQPNARLSVDVSTFFNRYDHLETLESGARFLQSAPAPARFVVPITFGNLMYGSTEGGELSTNFKLTDRWTLSPGYAFLEMHLHVKPTSGDATSVAEYQGSSPQHQVQLRSHVELPLGLLWDSSAYFVSALTAQGVPSYTRLDTQLTWRFAERGEISLVGQNLLRDTHLESMDQLTVVNSSLMKRSAYAKLTYLFW